MFLNGYPYTDLHELNLDFMLHSMEVLKQAFKDFTASNSLIFAEPLLHDITKSYAKNTIVLDQDGNAFIAIQNVPEGVQLNNTEYWLMVFNYHDYVMKANQNLTINYISNTDRSPFILPIDDWVVWDDVLYKVVQGIQTDDLLIPGTNIIHFTVEEFLKDFINTVTRTINNWHSDMLDTIDDYHDAMQHEVDRILAGATVDSEVIDARFGWDGVNHTTLGEALRTQFEILSTNEPYYDVITENMAQLGETGERNDISICDNEGYQIAEVDYIHQIKTKGFNSENVAGLAYIQESQYDFSLKDSAGNVIAGFKDGTLFVPDHINKVFRGKKVSILGDSISTYTGYNPPGYRTTYPTGNVNDVSETWWYKVIEALGGTLLVNASWSGSGVTGNSLDATGECGCSTARINALSDGVDTPDVILCFITSNDWKKDKIIGSFTPSDDIPADGTITDISSGYTLMLYKILTTYPSARVYCINSIEGRYHANDNTYPVLNANGDTIHDVNHAITEIAHIFGVEMIDLDLCGITYFNTTTYTVSDHTHPNEKGMNLIYNSVVRKLSSNYYPI